MGPSQRRVGYARSRSQRTFNWLERDPDIRSRLFPTIAYRHFMAALYREAPASIVYQGLASLRKVSGFIFLSCDETGGPAWV
jgi:hypothetical protein